ncbi:ribosomal RNA small subunit methyltransferase G [Parasponia andersonii]|uniref:Ribosomal RNA small subunit methyltransferase G n=1 Tax=Parasponia andersonii TaxID=3476 RepID=A0A2P5DMM0_PARAD|nr:ribosomal RNA small subunit methyltransferase G [Parasponia andersonii]
MKALMKRVSANSHQSRLIVEEARIKYSHETLLQEYLDVQKEFVSKKKKLQAVWQKRETLLAEVRFLRRRHNYLLKKQSTNAETQSVQNQNSHRQPQLSSKENKYNVNEPVRHGNTKVLDTKSISGVTENERGTEKEIPIMERIRLQKKPKNCLINGKRVGKKKITVQDQVVLEV